MVTGEKESAKMTANGHMKTGVIMQKHSSHFIEG